MNVFTIALMTFLPLVGMLVVCIVPERMARTIKVVALATTVLTMIASIGLYARFASLPDEEQRIDYVAGMETGSPLITKMVAQGAHPFTPPLGERAPWIPSAGIHYETGVDGLSLPLII